MGMTTDIVFLREADEFHKLKVDVLNACEKAGVAAPDEIEKYFLYESNTDAALEIQVDTSKYEWEDDDSSGFEIDIRELPEGVKKIRFFNSY